MNWTPSTGAKYGLPRAFFLVAAIATALTCSSALAGVLPIGLEQDTWSDMAFPSGVSGSYNSGTLALTVGATPSNDLEIGPEFGPSNPGKHYGTGGTLGGPFSATLSVSGVVVQPDGTVTSGGTLSVIFNGGAAGSLGTDYGIVAGAALLVGTVTEVLLDATGDNTLDVLFAITGGALQNDNPVLGTNFAQANLGVLRIAGVTLPGSFSSSFSLNGATIDVLGIPEPSSLALAAGLSLVAVLRRRKS